MTDTMESIINRQVLLFAVQRNIFCQISGKILDVRDAVLITADKQSLCITCEVFDRNRATIDATLGAREVEIIDGRDW